MIKFSPLLSVASLLTLCASASPSGAQVTSNAPPPTASARTDPSPKEDSAPSRLRDLSKALAGTWLLNVKFEPMGGMPKGITGTGKESWHAGPGGYTLVEEEQIPTPGGRGFLLGIFWWDSKAKKFQGMECNNQAPTTCDLKGALTDITVTWDGHTLAIHEVETHDGKKTVWHESWSNITSTSFTQTGDVTQPDGSTARFMTIQGTKTNN